MSISAAPNASRTMTVSPSETRRNWVLPPVNWKIANMAVPKNVIR
jgi:hypothetical protein